MSYDRCAVISSAGPSTLDVRAERVQPFVDALIAALDLGDVVDGALPFRAECREQHRHARANVRRLEDGRAKARWAATSARCGSQDDARSHPHELSTRHAGLEHLLCIRMRPVHCVAVTSAAYMLSAWKAGQG